MMFSGRSRQQEAVSGSGFCHVDVPFPMMSDLILNLDQIGLYGGEIVEFKCVGPASNNKKHGGERHRLSPGTLINTIRQCNGKKLCSSGYITKLELVPNSKLSLSGSFDCGKMRVAGGGGCVETLTVSLIRTTDASCDLVYSFACLPTSWRGRLSVSLSRNSVVQAGHEMFRKDIDCIIAEAKRRMLVKEKKEPNVEDT